ncbi:MFS transporter [Streptomyces sp. NRRL F-5053]|uniref:MFS transporter n=1 Tax=Streptomyces sp. NRRL F-5053 TaxID=1463854 RepID=UPI000A8013C6|nr:MFS transporter [Streptomyces sp. NRRL F-5053]
MTKKSSLIPGDAPGGVAGSAPGSTPGSVGGTPLGGDATPGPAATPPEGGGPGAAQDTLRPLGLGTLLLGAALPVIDFFIVNVAFPSIEADLHASSAALEMVVAGYAVAYAALLVLGGRLGDSHGRKRLFLWGAAAFGVTSLACGLAPGVWWLIAARLAQGAASALLFPQILASIQATTEGARRARAVGLFGSVSGLSIVLGQILGGVLVAADLGGTGWRAIFLVNVPVVALTLLLGARHVPDSRSAHPAKGDLAGTVLLALTLSALLLPLTEGRAAGWPLWSVLLLVAAPFLGWACYAVEQRIERSGGTPLLPPSLLRQPGVRRGALAGLPIFLGFSSWMFEIAFVLQQGLRFGALTAGLTLVPMGVAQFASSVAASRLTERLDTGRVLALSALVQAAGLLAVIALVHTRPAGLPPLVLAPALLLCGAGQGLQVPTYLRIVLSAVPTARAGAGTGLAATIQQSCLALGVATLGSLFLALVPHLGMSGALAVALLVQIAGLVALAAHALFGARRTGDDAGGRRTP